MIPKELTEKIAHTMLSIIPPDKLVSLSFENLEKAFRELGPTQIPGFSERIEEGLVILTKKAGQDQIKLASIDLARQIIALATRVKTEEEEIFDSIETKYPGVCVVILAKAARTANDPAAG